MPYGDPIPMPWNDTTGYLPPFWVNGSGNVVEMPNHVRQESVVLCHGVFDLLHLGHIRHLKEAASLGDRLVVSITADEHVNKGPGRPVFSAEHRMEALRALDCVDDVIISGDGTAVETIERLKPTYYVKGIDYDGSEDPGLKREIAAVEAHGGRFHVTRTDKWSSSRIINGQRLSEGALGYLDRVRERGWLDQIRGAFARADELNILFVGETIVDEYRYVSALAKPSKEFILATVEQRTPERFLGGVIAASLQAEWKNTKVITNDGEPLRKTRYVDEGFTRKLFEVYSRQRLDLSEQQAHSFRERLTAGVAEADVVVVMDFGHGLMDAGRRLVEQAKFLAVNAQTNAGNAGFNRVTRYKRADLVCIDMPEAQLAADMQDETDSETLADMVGLSMNTGNIVITHGRNGSYCPQHVPSFATRALDTMGAGDAFLSVAAPLVAAGLDLECAAFVGNVAGGLKTDIVGHRRHVGRDELLQTVEALLK